ncbi:MAG: hypothetical protein EBX41_07255, partial [Chitinophagia bacterium]|nr:hypothetical protein [Chitinophagia bacterium]
MLRYLSLLSRQWQSYKDSLNTARKYRNWQQTIAQLAPVNATGTKKLLIIRLDDIGDYILYRQCLPYYKQSEAWKEYNITLLGNEAWKPLFEVYDKVNVDNALWVNKKQYNEDGGYRRQIWEQLRAEGFETVICPARTRQLLLDDICALASHAPFKIGGHNQHKAKAINRLSDSVYTSFITLDNHKIEYDYNIQFVQKSCQLSFTDNPKLALP